MIREYLLFPPRFGGGQRPVVFLDELPVRRALRQRDVVCLPLRRFQPSLGVQPAELYPLQKCVVPGDLPVALVSGNGFSDDLTDIYLAIEGSRGQAHQKHAQMARNSHFCIE
jgi:hypothetical protein